MNSKCMTWMWAALLLASSVSWGAQKNLPSVPPVKIIFDTDIGNDVDDVLALAMLHSLQMRNACQLLGVTITKPDPLAGPFVDAMNKFYCHPNVPIGMTRANLTNEPSKFLGLVKEKTGGKFRYSHDLRSGNEACEATRMLRQILSAQADHSVVLVQVGYFSNLAALLETPPDLFSDLSGYDLVKRKVKVLSAMAGAFNARKGQRPLEYNVVQDLPAAKRLCQKWPTPIVWSGFEIGVAVPYPAVSIERDFAYVRHHPVSEAYYLYNPPPHERPCWDLTSVLYAIFPDRGYFDLSPEGEVTVEEDGFTRFTPKPGGRDRYLILDDKKIVRVKEAFVQLVSQPPHSIRR